MPHTLLLATLIVSGWMAQTVRAAELDLHTGNAPVEAIIPAAIPAIFTDVSPTGGDATLVLRLTTLITNAWFDAAAPYHPTAVGVYTRLGRQPPPATNEAVNIAVLYASHRVLNSLLPNRAAEWDALLLGVGLDPDDPATADPGTPHGIGTLAGRGVVDGRLHDGMNQRGDADGRRYGLTPYADYTGYRPVNTAYKLRHPARWQPALQRRGMGIHTIQQFVTPQYALTEPYSYPHPGSYEVTLPLSSYAIGSPRYRAQADEVLAASAHLTDVQKLSAELFDNKIDSLGFSAVFASLSQGLSLMEFIHLDFLTNMASFDAGIVIWREKRRFDAVRPFSAIRWLYGDQPVTAWGGPGRGTVHDLPANQWTSYLPVADHPEYPSGSACFCAAHAQAARRFLPWGDQLNWTVSRAAGSSRIEPGVTPAAPVDLLFETWTQFAADCGQSRVWAGVHFQAAVDESAQLCGTFGDTAFDYVSALVDGKAPLRPPSRGLGRTPDKGFDDPGKGKGSGPGKGNGAGKGRPGTP